MDYKSVDKEEVGADKSKFNLGIIVPIALVGLVYLINTIELLGKMFNIHNPSWLYIILMLIVGYTAAIIGNYIRHFAMPNAYFTDGTVIDNMVQKLKWMYGPQIALILILFYADGNFGLNTKMNSTALAKYEVIERFKDHPFSNYSIEINNTKTEYTLPSIVEALEENEDFSMEKVFKTGTYVTKIYVTNDKKDLTFLVELKSKREVWYISDLKVNDELQSKDMYMTILSDFNLKFNSEPLVDTDYN